MRDHLGLNYVKPNVRFVPDELAVADLLGKRSDDTILLLKRLQIALICFMFFEKFSRRLKENTCEYAYIISCKSLNQCKKLHSKIFCITISSYTIILTTTSFILQRQCFSTFCGSLSTIKYFFDRYIFPLLL